MGAGIGLELFEGGGPRGTKVSTATPSGGLAFAATLGSAVAITNVSSTILSLPTVAVGLTPAQRYLVLVFFQLQIASQTSEPTHAVLFQYSLDGSTWVDLGSNQYSAFYNGTDAAPGNAALDTAQFAFTVTAGVGSSSLKFRVQAVRGSTTGTMQAEPNDYGGSYATKAPTVSGQCIPIA